MRVQQLFDMTGEVAVVTGGGRGLGEAMAEALGEAGATVVIASRQFGAVKESAERMRVQGLSVYPASLDVTHPDEVMRVVEETVKDWGRIDVLINNSGTSWGAAALEMPLEAWKKVMDVNVTGTFLMSQQVARVMIEQGGGRIVNIASVAGLAGMGAKTLDAVGYSTSKGAVIAMTRDLAHKWAPHNIRVNAIAPGWFPTRMSQPILQHNGDRLAASIPLRRFGSMDDLKGVALLLASKASDYMTGTVVVVDGGATS